MLLDEARAKLSANVGLSDRPTGSGHGLQLSSSSYKMPPVQSQGGYRVTGTNVSGRGRAGVARRGGVALEPSGRHILVLINRCSHSKFNK